MNKPKLIHQYFRIYLFTILLLYKEIYSRIPWISNIRNLSLVSWNHTLKMTGWPLTGFLNLKKIKNRTILKIKHVVSAKTPNMCTYTSTSRTESVTTSMKSQMMKSKITWRGCLCLKILETIHPSFSVHWLIGKFLRWHLHSCMPSWYLGTRFIKIRNLWTHQPIKWPKCSLLTICNCVWITQILTRYRNCQNGLLSIWIWLSLAKINILSRKWEWQINFSNL